MSSLLFEEDARQAWDLDRLYNDLGRVKYDVSPPTAVLTDTEKELLCGLLLKFEPQVIADKRHTTLGTVKSSLSSTIYRYVKYLTGREGQSLNWRDVADWLEAAGYGGQNHGQGGAVDHLGQMPEVATFYGRHGLLKELKSTVLSPTNRMVSIIGHAGMGKTSLAAKLVNAIRNDAFRVDEPFAGGYIWQSLRYSPSLTHLLDSWLALMPTVSANTDAWYDKLNGVMEYLRENRCLIVIDNLESILDAESLGGYQADHTPYREFLKRLGEDRHQSSVVVTSRCHTPEIHGFPDSPVQDMVLPGLGRDAADQLLADQQLPKQTKSHWQTLISIYRGNPLMLKLATRYIMKFFDGNVSEFLQSGKTILSRDLRALVGQQYYALSEDEQEVLRQLVTHSGPMPMDAIHNPRKMDAVDALLNRCLIEKSADGIMPIPVVVDYIRNYLR